MQLAGQTVNTGNITATAAAEQGIRHLTGSGSVLRTADQSWINPQNPGLFNLQMNAGSYSAGRAAVFIANSFGVGHSQPPPAQSIKVGNVTVNGVGEADINLAGHAIQAGSVTAVPPAAT